MSRPVRLAVMGAGLIGKRHAMHVRASADAELACVIDPTAAGEAVARTVQTMLQEREGRTR